MRFLRYLKAQTLRAPIQWELNSRRSQNLIWYPSLGVVLVFKLLLLGIEGMS